MYIYFLPKLTSQNQITFRQLSVKEGLSQNSVISIAQDSIGFLWIATQNGLNKYDGKSFTNYPFDFLDITRPNYSNLGKVYVDRQGKVWIIPIDKTLHFYNAISDTFESLEGITNVSVIYQDNNYNYWIGTYGNGLFFIDNSTKKVSNIISQNQVKGTIYSIALQDNDEILLSVDKKIIEVNINTKEFSTINPETLFGQSINENFSVSVMDAAAKQWVGTFGNGLYYRYPNKNTFYRISDLSFSDPLPININIIDLYFDSRDRLWVATYGSGLYMINFETKKIIHFNAEKHNPRALHYNDVLCIYEDYTKTLWFGTDGAGLSYYDEYLEKFNSFTNLETPDNISIDVVRAITLDNDENIWIGTSGKGLTQYEPLTNSWRTFTTLNSELPSNRIMSLLVDKDDDLWIGTQGGGLTIYDKNGRFIDYSQDSNRTLSAKTIWNIFKDSKDQIWLATRDNGLIQFDKNKGIIKNYNLENVGLPSNNIRVITEDDKGFLWLGTDENGIVKFDINNEKTTVYQAQKETNSLSSNSIKSLYYDVDNVLWIGTNNHGLDAYHTKEKKFYNYTVNEGLSNNVIYAILPDDKGNLWLSSNKGISKFSINNSSFDTPIITNYNNYAGLVTEFNTGAYFKDERKGNLYFGGLDGFYWFNPNSIKENKILAKTAITSFEVLNKPYPITLGTKLKYNENTISFTFSSLQYSLPQKNQYEYKLLNYDEGWIYNANNNFARYTRLPSGAYQFLVKSSNYDGVWNETPEVFNFSIATPWYYNTFVKIIYALLFLITIFGIYSYLKWRWAIQLDLRLKKEEAQRFKKLNEYKSKLYTDIAHEFRTPLTLIAGPIDSKLTDGNLSDYDYTNFSTIKRNTNRLTALVDQLLQLAKLEKGKLRLKVSKGNLGLFLHTIAQSFEYKADSKKINYSISIAPITDAWYDEDVIEKVVNNLLSNAFKYTLENGRCEFTVSTTENKVLISVKNTVENLAELQLENLFTRFYQKDEYTEGAGIGLSLVKELVKRYKGKIKVLSENDNTIHFKVSLPVDKDTFRKKDIVKVSKQELLSQQTYNNIDQSSDISQKENGELPILLLVEDHAEVRAFIKNSLMQKYKIVEAKNGKEGIEKALEQVPDIILSDVRMPILDGIELCNTLKTDERTSHIPIILLTAGTGEENELKGLQSGADDFITKPFKLQVLEKRLANLIEVRKALRNRYSQEFILKPTDISITSTDETFLNKVQRIIDSDFENPDFNAVTFSKKIGMSRMQLHRKLLAYTGLSTTGFIRSQRLKQALHILKTSDATINEIAYTVGFNTPSYFIKCFKETYKKTPSEYLQITDK